VKPKIRGPPKRTTKPVCVPFPAGEVGSIIGIADAGTIKIASVQDGLVVEGCVGCNPEVIFDEKLAVPALSSLWAIFTNSLLFVRKLSSDAVHTQCRHTMMFVSVPRIKSWKESVATT
jgi:hypothetical protein